MSELIHNKAAQNLDPARKHHLKRLIMDLHAGRLKEEVVREFRGLFQGVSAEEIAAMEEALISDGMPVEEIQKMCDVHAAVMGTSVDSVHQPSNVIEIPGHPLNQMEAENRAIEALIASRLMPSLAVYSDHSSEANSFKVLEILNELADVDKHYLRKENLIFPFLERVGITAPPKVMWGTHDEIRSAIKGAKVLFMGKRAEAARAAADAAQKITDMIFKERNILYPMLLNALSEDDWAKVAHESEDLGFCLVLPQAEWKPEGSAIAAKADSSDHMEAASGSTINLGTGVLRPDQLELMLNHLPVDITFIDENDVVRYFSSAKERLFPRNKTIIGRLVQNCHPPKSMAVVNQILDDFKSKAKDSEDFWISMHGMMIYIRYFAVRDAYGKYAGALEVSQEISKIKTLEGEKRIIS